MFKRCGSFRNDMSKLKKKTFHCEPEAVGVMLKIALKGTLRYLTICEVYVFGTGMSNLEISIANRYDNNA